MLAAGVDLKYETFRGWTDVTQDSLTDERDILEAETVVLVAEDGTPIGTADKALVHDFDTALHLAFSCHVFDENERILVTRRALTKKAWPGVWTNSFCGHPAPGETLENAAIRRASHELGIDLTELTLTLPDFRYRAIDASGIVENEICPVFTAVTNSTVTPRADEVMEWRWVPRDDLVSAVRAIPWAFSPWLTLQLPLLFPQV